MILSQRFPSIVAILFAALVPSFVSTNLYPERESDGAASGILTTATVSDAVEHDVSPPLASLGFVQNANGARRIHGPNEDKPKVTPIPAAVIEKFNLDTTFYKKHVDYKGFSILGSAKVSDAGLLEARYLIDKLLGDREDILKTMIKRGCRFMVMAPTEMTTDVPEQRYMKNDPKTDWDRRARGLGGKLSSCGEENLLNLKGDRYGQENILIHEFNHAIHEQGLHEVDPTFDGRLRRTYQAAMEKGLWKGMYPATNHKEYWAEGAQAYFDCMRPQFGANTREKLARYDEGLFKLVDEVYKQSKFRYVRYVQRNLPAPKKDLDKAKAEK